MTMTQKNLTLKDLQLINDYRNSLGKRFYHTRRPIDKVLVTVLDLPDFQNHIENYAKDYNVKHKAGRKLNLLGMKYTDLVKLKFTEPDFWGLTRGRIDANYVTDSSSRVFSVEEITAIGKYINRVLQRSKKHTKKSVRRMADQINRMIE